MEVFTGSGASEPPLAALNIRKRSAIDPTTAGPADGLILVSSLRSLCLSQLTFCSIQLLLALV